MPVIDLTSWAEGLNVLQLDLVHTLSVSWCRAEELQHLAHRQNLILQGSPDLRLRDALIATERAQGIVFAQLADVLTMARREVG